MSWPAPSDPAAAERLLERFAATGPASARLLRTPEHAAMLRALGGNSPFLSDLAVREAATIRRLGRAGPAAVVGAALRRVARCPPRIARPELAVLLRAAKREVALATAIADIGGLWTLDQVTASLSALAEAALSTATAHLLAGLHDRGTLRLPRPRRPADGSGLAVLGMGKLGARELNYSSDVDLIILFDPAAHPEVDGLGSVFSRLARDLCTLMEARDGNGYVFRTDLRLRPDPAATPPAVSLPAALAYYESMGENWERAAMIKARPMAGDLALGERFLHEIRPFVWRRHLDFAAIADIRAMKRRMDAHHDTALPSGPDPVARIAGHDVKLGAGGIRGVEFAVQTLQLVWGGRDPRLRARPTVAMLDELSATGHLSPLAAAELAQSYVFLRGVEHRIQMVADRQTHALPADAAGLERIAVFLGYPDAAAFADTLLGHLERVLGHEAALFESKDRTGEAVTAASLGAMGFTEPERVLAALRDWRAGLPRAFRSVRARELLERLLPRLLAALAAQREPDAAFARADTLFGRLPAGVNILSLLHRRPALLDRVAAVLGAAPSLADHLAQMPAALEGLLSPCEAPPDLEAILADARSLDDAAALVRRSVRGAEFSLAVAQMEGRLDADPAGAARTALADAALRALLPRVLDDHASRHGVVPGGGLAVVLMGKAGGREMMAGSDLDLMLVYDHAPDAESDGARPLPASTYFIRAAHAVVQALTAKGSEGPLYDVDMRLRPSGRKGPVAVSLSSFRRYHAEDAWTWERMALTRARVVAGPPELCARVEAAVADAMAQPSPALHADALAMRQRMLRDLPPAGPWDVKLRPGGQIEVEFVVQVLLLQTPAARPAQTIATALDRLRAAGALGAADEAVLRRADHLWRSVQGLLRITLGRALPATLPAPALDTLLRATGDCDAAAFRARLEHTAAEVRAVFNRVVGALG